jgi:hypothetical protein
MTLPGRERAAIAAEQFRNLASEAQMQETIEELVERKGGRLFHVRNTGKSPEMVDFPDLVIICPPVLAIVELKSLKREITPGQQRVADLLAACDSLVVGIVRPWDLDALLEALA